MKLSFETAWVHLKRGGKIRRADWPKELYLRKQRVVDYGGETHDDVKEVWAEEDDEPSPFEASWFCTSDLFENDWEVIE